MLSDAFEYIYNKTGEEERIPKINPIIGEGIPYHQMKDLHLAIHRQLCTLLRSDNEPDLPFGFNYVDFEILSVEEEYAERGKESNKVPKRQGSNRDGFPYLPTDTYYVRFIFDNNGDRIERNVQVPFIRRGNVMNLRGTKYGVSVVMKTRGVSVTPKGFFVAFDSNPVNFERISRSFLVNGSILHYYLPISNDLHRIKKKGGKAFQPPLIGWMFAKMGPVAAFKRFLDIDVEFYDVHDEKLREMDTNDYAVCRAPLPVKGERHCPFAVVIKKKQLTKEAEMFIGTLFYVASHYGERFSLENMDSLPFWKIMLGYAMHGEVAYTDPKHLFMVDKHLTETVEKYLDPIFKSQLLHEGLDFEDIYGFFFHIVERYAEPPVTNASSLSNAYGRYLTCAEYLLVTIRHNIRLCMWGLKAAAKNSITGESGMPISKKRAEGIINLKISADVLTNISTGHGEVAPLQVTCDNMLIGVTSRCIDETEAKKSSGSGKKVVDLTDPTKHIDASWIEIGSIANLPKSAPFGLAILNAYLQFDMWGKIYRKESNRKVLSEVQADLRQKGHTA